MSAVKSEEMALQRTKETLIAKLNKELLGVYWVTGEEKCLRIDTLGGFMLSSPFALVFIAVSFGR